MALEFFVDLVHELFRRQKGMVRTNQDGEILSHLSRFNDFDTDLLQSLRKLDNVRGVIDLAAVLEPSRPRIDGGDGIGRRWFPLLMHAVVASDGTVGCFRLNRLAIGRSQDRSHQAEGTIALGYRVGLNVSVIVFASPQITTFPLEIRRNHIIDQSVFVRQSFRFEGRSELFVEDLLEDHHEASVVNLQMVFLEER